MSKTFVYTALVVVCLGLGALIAGLAVHFAQPKGCSITPQSRSAECLLVQHQGEQTVTVQGRLQITETTNSDISITGNITGLPVGLHGFHIHQYGVNGNDCTSSKGHYNPHGKNHGAPSVEERHVGDLGNINVVNPVNFNVQITDHLATLFGADSIMGRAIVIHSGEDDLVSSPTGNAGSRLACCTIMHLPE